MDFLLQFIPAELTSVEALGLIIFSYFTSAVTVTFGIGGGVMMLMAMASILPVSIVIPVSLLHRDVAPESLCGEDTHKTHVKVVFFVTLIWSLDK